MDRNELHQREDQNMIRIQPIIKICF